jgi:hypothetical protein
MKKSWMLVLAGALLAAGSLAMSARAQSNVVYAVEYKQSTNRFGTIDLLNGNFTKISSFGAALINDIAYCPTNGTLYGISNTTTLVTFNKTNGALIRVASLSVSGIQSLAFRPSDGALFGATQSRLYTINPANGTATSVGIYGSPTNLGTTGQNIRFAQDGNLYVSNTSTNTDIYRINTTNGAATRMGQAVGYPYLMLQNASSNMYGVFINLGSASNATPELATFNLSSFVNGGTNANGSTHQITVTLVGAGTNFPANFNFSGNVPQSITNLTVPVSATGPSNQTAVVGSNVVFSTAASGTGPYNYAWSKNGAAISGQTNSSLTLNNLTTNDAATYSVIVGGAMGTVTNSATLTVNVPVTVTVPPANQTTVAGSNVTFSVTATGTGLSYQWLFNGSVIGTSNSLTLNNVTTSQAGVYTVIVNGAAGSVTNSATLTVTKAGATVTLGSLSQTYNGTARPATATTTPTGLTVTFTYNSSANVPTNAGSYTVIGTINDANYQGSATNTLVIAKATLTITAVPNTKTYDGTTSAAAIPTVSGLQGSDSVTGLAETYDTKNAGIGKTLSVSAYTVNDGNAGANYTVSTVSAVSISNNIANNITNTAGVITPATLTVTADDKNKISGMSNPPLTASYNGFVSGESASVLSSPVVLNTTATTKCGAGKYPITAGSAAAANYTIQFVNGTLLVASAPQLDGAKVSVNETEQFVVSYPTIAGQTYQLEYTDDLSTGTWTPLGTPFAGTDGIVAVTNSMSITPNCFFRVEVLEVQ